MRWPRWSASELGPCERGWRRRRESEVGGGGHGAFMVTRGVAGAYRGRGRALCRCRGRMTLGSSRTRRGAARGLCGGKHRWGKGNAKGGGVVTSGNVCACVASRRRRRLRPSGRQATEMLRSLRRGCLGGHRAVDAAGAEAFVGRHGGTFVLSPVGEEHPSAKEHVRPNPC